ncbi:MAG: TlpA family protein disulfide reductase [bacterium]|nr:TlpA family protein disulfide reductase [bacterium]
MNKTTMLLVLIATLVPVTFAAAQDMTAEELETGLGEALAAGDEGKLYELIEYAYESGAEFVLAGKTDEALKMVGIVLEGEPNIGRYFAADERFSALAENAEYQELLKEAEIAAIERNITVPLGSPAPDFKLEDTNGVTYKLSDFLGKVVLLNVWATWCPPCQAEIPDLIEIQDEYGGDDFAILSITVDEGNNGKTAVEIVNEFVAEKGINYPVLMDDGEAAQAYIAKSGGIPETYTIDKEGNVAYFILGGAEKTAFVSAIEPALK